MVRHRGARAPELDELARAPRPGIALLAGIAVASLGVATGLGWGTVAITATAGFVVLGACAVGARIATRRSRWQRFEQDFREYVESTPPRRHRRG